MFKMFREEKHPRQWWHLGHYATRLLSRFDAVREKLNKMASYEEVQYKMNFIVVILKVQLAKELGKREGFPCKKSFLDCAQELVDACTR